MKPSIDIPDAFRDGLNVDRGLALALKEALESDADIRSLFGRNMWLEGEGCSIYVRLSRRLIGDHILPVLDLASFEFDPEFQSKGLARSLFAVAKAYSKRRIVYVEAVFEPSFEQFFLSRPEHWHPDPHSPHSYWANLDELPYDSLLRIIRLPPLPVSKE